jgi:hypothetical protein
VSRFSGRQIAAIVLSVCAAVVLTPTIVYAAATSSSVTIADPGHPARKAHVARGKLFVGDGKGALTVDGAVAARPVAPARPWNAVNFVSVSSGTPRSELFSSTVPNKLNLTSFTVATAGNSGTVTLSVQVYISNSGAGDCVSLGGASFSAAERFLVTVPDGQTVTVPYPTPLVYTAYGSTGDKYCVDVEGSGPSGYSAYVSASGFLS